MTPSAGFIGFVVDRVQKIAYCDGDCRRSEVGVRVLDFLSSWGDDPQLVDVVRALHVVYPGQRPTGDEAEHLRRYARQSGRPDSLGMPSAILTEGVIEDASDVVASGSLSWGFLIDLDTRTLHVFDGSLERATATWALEHLPDEDELFATSADPIAPVPGQSRRLLTMP